MKVTIKSQKLWKKMLIMIASCITAAALIVPTFSVGAAEGNSEAPVFVPGKELIGEEVLARGSFSSLTEDSLQLSSSHEGEEVLIIPGKQIYYHDWETNIFEIQTNHGSYRGMCAQPAMGTPSGSFSVHYMYSPEVKVMLLCLPGGPLEDIGEAIFMPQWTDDERYGYAHAVIGYLYSGQLNGLNEDEINWIQNVIAFIQNDVLTNSVYMETINIHNCYIAFTGDTKQDIVWAEKLNPGNLVIRKSSSLNYVSDSKRSYSLAGAEFTLYKAGTDNAVCQIITGEDGIGSYNGITPGSYEIIETKAPQGYLLDSKRYPVQISEDDTFVHHAKDMPAYTDISLLLRKKDAETQEPQGAASLKGAYYKVSYYDIVLDDQIYSDHKASLSALNQETPFATWFFETNADGLIEYSDDFLLEGDQLFKHDETGITFMPLGTLKIEEVNPSEGYKLDETIYIIPITMNGSEIKMGQLPNSDTYFSKEQVIKGAVTLKKIDGDTKEALSDIQFLITSKTSGRTWTIITDSEGIASTPACSLPYDSYTYEEIEDDHNKGCEMVSGEFCIETDNVTVDLGIIENYIPKIENPKPTPTLTPTPEKPEEKINKSENLKKTSVPETYDRLMSAFIFFAIAAVSMVILAGILKFISKSMKHK